jgi:nucleotide-binding universal stress UspA family protein
VLIVPAGLAASAAVPGSSFGNVLCAVDFETASSAAYQQALALAAESESRMTLLHVVQVPEYHSLATLDAWRMLQASIPRDKKKSGRFQVRVVTGDPAAQIARIGADVNADVIVVGVTSRNAVSRRLFGATASRVMRIAGRPVLAVPEGVRRPMSAAAETRALEAVA